MVATIKVVDIALTRSALHFRVVFQLDLWNHERSNLNPQQRLSTTVNAALIMTFVTSLCLMQRMNIKAATCDDVR